MIARLVRGLPKRFFSSSHQEQPESSFLENVSQYFDRAGTAAGIPKDMLNFLKSPDYSLKFNIPYRTGNFLFIQTPVSLKLSKLLESNTRLTDCPQRVVPGTRCTFQLNKLRPLLA